MKLDNVRIVGEIKIPSCSGLKMLDQYRQAKEKLDGESGKRGGSMWLDLESSASVPHQISQSVIHNDLQPFTACIVGYDIPQWETITHGLYRRKATAMLRRMGLQEPSSVQTILLACHTIVTGQVRKISAENADRRVMCAVPFNPEEGRFFYFGLGYDGKGDFQKWHYVNADGGFNFSENGDRYFWHNPQTLQAYCFPLLLGIRAS